MARLSITKNRKDLGFFGVGLVNPKNGTNVGGVIRATGAFQGGFVAVQGSRHENKGDWRHLDTEGGYRRFPVYLDVPDVFSYLPYGAVPVAVELVEGSTNLTDFEHPPEAMYIFGPEDGALPPEVLAKCKATIHVPTIYSLNLYACASVVLYDREAKRSKAKASETVCPRCQSNHISNVVDELSKDRLINCNACGWVFKP